MTQGAPAPGDADPLDLHGVVPPTFTVFDEDETVDLEATAAHARFVVDRGCHGVFALGTTGEFPMLTPEEQTQVVDALVDEIDEVPVLAGVGAPSTHRTVAQATMAEAAGADGLIVVTPYYYALDDRAAVEHYERVAAAVDLPVYVYHIPSRTGNKLSLDAFGAIAGIDGVAGVKDTSGDVSWLGQAIDQSPDLTFMMGSNALLYPGLAQGCSGVVSSVGNVFPELVVDLYEAVDAGDEARARECQSTVYRVRRAFKRGPAMSGPKTALSIRSPDFRVGDLRSPLRAMEGDEREALRAELTDLGLV